MPLKPTADSLHFRHRPNSASVKFPRTKNSPLINQKVEFFLENRNTIEKYKVITLSNSGKEKKKPRSEEHVEVRVSSELLLIKENIL